MINTEIKKLNIIELIINIQDKGLLIAIEKAALQLVESRKQPNIWNAVRPTRKNVSLDQMIQEQNTEPLNASTFFSLARAVELTDPIDELLADLTA